MTKKIETPDAPPAPEMPEPEFVIATPPGPFADLVPGRIVHFWPTEVQERHCAPGPWAAIVTAIHVPLSGEATPAGTVTLNVQMPTPAPIGEDPVHRIKDVHYSAEKAEGCWSWIKP